MKRNSLLPSQPSLKGSVVPSGHIQVNSKHDGSSLLKLLRGNGVGVVFDSELGSIDFYVSKTCGVVFLREEELVQGNEVVSKRISKLVNAKSKFQGVVLVEVTHLSKQHFKELQIQLIDTKNLSVIPVSSEEESVLVLQQLVNCHSYQNPILNKKQTDPSLENNTIMTAIQCIPGLGAKKAKDLLVAFKSFEGINNAADDEIEAIIGKKASLALIQFMKGS